MENKRIIKVVPYSNEWIFKFKKEANILSKILTEEVINTYHVGSTSIPGMYAKPTIDILIEVKNTNEIDKYILDMESIGYICLGEYGIKGRRFFYKGEFEREFHVHIYQNKDSQIIRHVNFRDYLICHTKEALEYAQLKLGLVKDNEIDIEKYMAGKDKFIKDIDNKAADWENALNRYIIQTHRLGLRKWKDSDYLPFSEINQDPQVMEFFPNVLTKNESDSLLDKFKAHLDRHGFGVYAVENIETKEFIGYVGFNIPEFQLDFTPCVEILWRLGAKFWGKGYATEAAKACLEYGFGTLAFEEVVSFTSVLNNRSENVMKRVGMIKLGEFMHPKLPENHWLCRHVLYSIKKENYKNCPRKFINNTNIKNIIFDVGNVLIKFDPNVPIDISVSPIPENINLLKRLSVQYQLFAITDASLEQINFESKKFNFYSCFKDIIISEECGYKKNNPEIYMFFLRKHNITLNECVFIDDRVENIKAARSSGIHAILYTTLDRCILELSNLGVICNK